MNAETTLQTVRELSEGERTRHPQPKRRITYQLMRGRRPLLRLGDVQNPLALPMGMRLIWQLSR